MASLPARLRRSYGAGAVHLLLIAAGFALFGYVLSVVGVSALWNPRIWWKSIAVWFLGAVVLHDLILFPVYSLIDLLVRLVTTRRPLRSWPVPVLNYVRVPSLAAALTFVVFLPGIISQGAGSYHAATGQTQQPFLGRWIALSVAFYLASSLAFSLRTLLVIRRLRRTHKP